MLGLSSLGEAYCFILNRNLLTWPRALLHEIRRLGLIPVIVDLGSSYQPLLDWYDTDPCMVAKFEGNPGPYIVWSGDLLDIVGDNPYCVTDSDLDLSGVPTDCFSALLSLLDAYRLPKIGLSLALNDLPQDGYCTTEVQQWEKQWWVPAGELFEARVDTTFAIYKGGYRKFSTLAQRTRPPYTARHLPWYLTPSTITDEYKYYLEHCGEVSTWGIKMRQILNSSRGTRV